MLFVLNFQAISLGVMGIDVAFSTIFLLDFGTVPTV
jgi:hypothetical protein